jgi:hypothetical protein
MIKYKIIKVTYGNGTESFLLKKKLWNILWVYEYGGDERKLEFRHVSEAEQYCQEQLKRLKNELRYNVIEKKFVKRLTFRVR